MKTRLGFVSNSSSSSFIIPTDAITGKQFYQILHYAKIADAMGLDCERGWYISNNEHFIKGETIMDNFDFHYFLKIIGVDMDKVEWRD